MSTCRIVGGGDFSPELWECDENDMVIAADSGYDHLARLRVKPDVLIGDFDSLKSVPEGENVVRLPIMKDDTDLIAACRTGLDRGFKRFVLYGVLGGRRFSHSVAAMQTLLWLDIMGASGTIKDGRCEISLLKNGTKTYEAGETGSISVFAAGDSGTVTLRGLLYSPEGYELKNTYPIGVSNSFTGEKAEIIAENGGVFIIKEP